MRTNITPAHMSHCRPWAQHVNAVVSQTDQWKCHLFQLCLAGHQLPAIIIIVLLCFKYLILNSTLWQNSVYSVNHVFNLPAPCTDLPWPLNWIPIKPWSGLHSALSLFCPSFPVIQASLLINLTTLLALSQDDHVLLTKCLWVANMQIYSLTTTVSPLLYFACKSLHDL